MNRGIAVSQMVAMENPTCTARLVQFGVVAVAMQPRFHHIQHLNEAPVGGGCSNECVLLVQQERVHFYSCD